MMTSTLKAFWAFILFEWMDGYSECYAYAYIYICEIDVSVFALSPINANEGTTVMHTCPMHYA